MSCRIDEAVPMKGLDELREWVTKVVAVADGHPSDAVDAIMTAFENYITEHYGGKL